MAKDSVFSQVLANNPEIIHRIFESLPEPTFLINRHGTYVEAWGGTDTKRHHDPSSIVGLDQFQVLPREKALWFLDVIRQVIQEQQPQELEYSLDPKELPCFEGVSGPDDLQYFSAFVIPISGEEKVLWTVRNITEYKVGMLKLASQQLELEKLTNIDHLTGVYNRYALDRLLPIEIQLASVRHNSAAIVMIDIDCFKELNDHLGHLQGDVALQKVSQIIQQWCGDIGTCFRFGGDEFLVVLQDIDKEACIKKAHQLLRLVESKKIPNPQSRLRPTLSVTVGIKHYQTLPESLNLEAFIGQADKALFFAKRQERGTVHIVG